MKRTVHLVLMLVLAIGLVPGCSENEAEPVVPVTPTGSVAPTSTPSTTTAQRLLYFNRGEHLGVAGREVVDEGDLGNNMKMTLQALCAGPVDDPDLRYGLTGSCIPTGTVVKAVTVDGDMATVDLSREFESGGGSLSMLLRVAQVVYTVTQFDGVERVAFKLDGKPVKAIGGEGISVDPPVTRADFEGQAPAILVESPVPGEEVTSPIESNGSANVFEAQFNVEVKDPNGKVIVAKPVMASSGTGTRGTFEISIPYASSATGLGMVTFFDISEKDGSRIDVIEIPVLMK